MSNIEKIDKNFSVESIIKRTDVKFYNVCKEPFKLYGLLPPTYNSKFFRRMPKDVAAKVSSSVCKLHTNTAGGRIRFCTDSRYIAIHANMPMVCKMPHMAFTGSAGFDLYIEEDNNHKYLHTFVPPLNIKNGFESEFNTNFEKKMREYTLNFPLYSDVSSLYIALEKNACVSQCGEYKYNKPIVFYGSSITQGGCASRPGNSYQSIISGRLSCDFVNLGFSGSAKAEMAMANYIAQLEMCMFVYDYDHNAQDCNFLKNTHENMYKIIRLSNQDLPIICVSRPDYTGTTENSTRRKIIKDTVLKAQRMGDKNIYYIDGRRFGIGCSENNSLSVDGCHPNDLGFMNMANVIGTEIERLLCT